MLKFNPQPTADGRTPAPPVIYEILWTTGYFWTSTISQRYSNTIKYSNPNKVQWYGTWLCFDPRWSPQQNFHFHIFPGDLRSDDHERWKVAGWESCRPWKMAWKGAKFEYIQYKCFFWKFGGDKKTGVSAMILICCFLKTDSFWNNHAARLQNLSCVTCWVSTWFMVVGIEGVEFRWMTLEETSPEVDFKGRLFYLTCWNFKALSRLSV